MLKLYENIKMRRKELKMSQEELSLKVGYKSRSAISHIEKGERDIPESKIIAIANALNTTPALLMGPPPEKKENAPEGAPDTADILRTYIREKLGRDPTAEEFLKIDMFADTFIKGMDK